MTRPVPSETADRSEWIADDSWQLVRRAAAADGEGRTRFATHYLPVIQAYLGARWSGGPLIARLDDAVQDVFLECYREGGALHTADDRREVPFRAFLFGVIRNVAMRHEAELQRDRRQLPASTMFLQGLAGREASLSRVFDDAWARALMMQAGELQRRRAGEKTGDEARNAGREIELLRMRFQEGLPIREIAALWNEDPARTHRLYHKARVTFQDCLRLVVRAQTGMPDSESVDRECERLLDLLGGR